MLLANWLHRYDRVEIHRLSSRKRKELLLRKLLNIGKGRSKHDVDHGIDNFQLCQMRVIPGFGTVDYMPIMRGTRGECEREAARLGSSYRVCRIS